GGVSVGADVLAKGSARLLDRVQPGERAADRRMVRGEAAGLEGRHCGSGSVDVVDAPAAEPGPVAFLLGEQPVEAGLERCAVSLLVAKRLEGLRGHVGGRLVR